jgi:uncharacterized membrane protein YfcA
MIPLELALGFGIGLSLGLLGGGGSLLTVPALVYLVGQTPQSAMTTSLVIVGTNSLMGALMHRAQGTLNWRAGVIFGGSGMLVSYLSASISDRLPPEVLLAMFAFLMVIIGIVLFLRQTAATEINASSRPLGTVLASGAGVGLLTGVLGVGGGFLTVPALVMLVGLPIQMSVGTSLVVITLNSFAGFIGHLGRGSFDLILTLIFAAAGLVGTFVGTKLSSRVSSSKLQKVFAGFVIALAFVLLYDNLPKIF